MAEIKIEEKSSKWPWFLLALLLVGAVAVWIASEADEEELAEVEETETVTREVPLEVLPTAVVTATELDAPETVASFVKYVDDENGKMGIDHVYTHAAFERLANAMQSTAKTLDYDLSVDLEELNRNADRLKVDPSSLSHANLIKDNFNAVVKAFENIQKAKFPGNSEELDRLRMYRDQLNPEVKTLNQRETVKGFFDEAARLLDKMV